MTKPVCRPLSDVFGSMLLQSRSLHISLAVLPIRSTQYLVHNDHRWYLSKFYFCRPHLHA
jgi:hypothetical protein